MNPLLFAGAGALLKGVGGLFSGGAAKKKQKQDEQLAYQQAQQRHGIAEDTRLALLRGLMASAGERGIKGAVIDPKLLEARPFTGIDPARRTEDGDSLVGGILSGLGGLAGSVGSAEAQEQEEAKREARMLQLLCALNPRMPGCPSSTSTPAPNTPVGDEPDYFPG